MARMMVGLSGEHFGERGSPQSIRRLIGRLKATDVIQMTCKILHAMEKVGSGGLEHQEKYIELFPEDVRSELSGWLARGSQNGGGDVLFQPQQLLALQRLALSYGQEGDPTSFDGGARARAFLLLAAQVADVADITTGFDLQSHSLGAHTDSTDLSIALYLLRKAHVNELTFYRAIAGRSFQMWFNSEVPWHSDLEPPDEYCLRKFSVSLNRFVAIALSPTFPIHQDDTPIPPAGSFNLKTFFRNTRVTSQEATSILGLLRTPRAICDCAAQSTYWDFTTLESRPYLDTTARTIAPCSLSFAFKRATTGIFWMLHSEYKGRVHDFTSFFGNLFEDYCFRLAKSIETSSVQVTPPIKYSRQGAAAETSDIIISAFAEGRPYRIFVECGAIRPPRSVLSSGDAAEFEKYLLRLVGKLRQLDRRIADHKAGLFGISDYFPTGTPYIPLLVVDEPLYWSPFMRSAVDKRSEGESLFSDPISITRPIICDIRDFEYLVQKAEQGTSCPELLLGYLRDSRSQSLRNFLHESTSELEAPTLVIEGFRGIMSIVAKEIFDREPTW